MTILSSNSPTSLPRGIICDILSYLPVKSLQRFKCVCKHWNGITQDFHFICLHYNRTPFYIDKKPPQSSETDEFIQLSSEKGLILEYATRTSSDFPSSPNLRYRIRNPELQHQILEIPDSEKPILNMCMVFDPDCQVLKLLSVVYDELIGDQVFGYEVLDLRNEESTYSWRPLNLPQQSRGEARISNLVKKHTNQIKLIIGTGTGTAYSIWDAAANSQIGIDILDMVNDSYIGYTTLPTSYYTKDDCKPWKGKLSFVKIVKEELHVLVLDVYKKQIKWADEKLIIKLPFLKDLSVVPQIKLFGVNNTNKLYFSWQDKESFCNFDITTGKLQTLLSSYKESQTLNVTGPCLFTFKGMHTSSSQ